MSNPTADQYRQNAEDCRWNADRAPADEKDRWLKVAADWEKWPKNWINGAQIGRAARRGSLMHSW
jgi:hypothetical protein